MSLKNKKALLILIGIVLFIFFSPFLYFKANTKIEAKNILNEIHISGSTINNETLRKGISWNEKGTDLKNDTRIVVNKSSVLNFGVYTKITLEISLKRVVNKETVKTIVQAESKIWGLGKLSCKKNNFNNTIREIIDSLPSKI